MKKLLFAGLIALLLQAHNQSEAQLAQRMDSLVQVHVTQGFNGNVLYSRNDSIIFSGNYGYADFASKQALNDASTFELASNSKQFTAVAIIQLEEKGLLQYHSKVSEIITGFPYPDITVEHLLRHQSGLPDEQKLMGNKQYWDRRKKATSKDLVEVLIRHQPELTFAPGSKYQYSNTGYNVLAAIIEVLSGQSYAAYLQEHLFAPAGMKTASVVTIDNDPEAFDNAARGYTYHPRKKRYQKALEDKNHRHLHWMRTINGGAGIYASVLDLEKWKQALRYNQLISRQSKERMFSTDEVSVKYGFGVAVYKGTSKGKWVYHTGSWGGAKTMTLYLPESNELIVILSNNRYANTYKTFDEGLYRLLLP